MEKTAPRTLRQILPAGLLALGLMAGIFAAGKVLPPAVWLATLYPGMLLAEALISTLPDTANAWLIGSGDDGPAVFASLGVGSAFLFWWACALVALKVWGLLPAKRSPLSSGRRRSS